MKKGVIAGLIIFFVVFGIGLGVNYVKKSANDDFNSWACGVQTEWGIPKGAHLHISDWEGKKYVCK